MRDVLTDLTRQTVALFDVIKITGTKEETKIQAVDKDKTLFLTATLTAPLEEFEGEFGMSNLAFLNSLLNFSSYRTETSSLTVKREVKPNVGETVTEFRFREASGAGSSYKTMAANLVGEQATVNNIPWDIKITPSKPKLAEFTQLAGIYGSLSENVGIHTEDGKLIFSIGGVSESTNNATLIFATDVVGEIKTQLHFQTSQFLSMLKLIGTNQTTLNITTRGVIGLTVVTSHGTYNYYLRGKR